MRVLVMVKATCDSETGMMPTTERFEAMGRFNEALVQAGVMLMGEGLKPSSSGARIRYSGAARTVNSGPFEATNELVAGFWLWQVTSMDEAIEWARRCPNPMNTDSDIEIRPLYEGEDFGDSFTPELQPREAQLRTRIDQQSKGNS